MFLLWLVIIIMAIAVIRLRQNLKQTKKEIAQILQDNRRQISNLQFEITQLKSQGQTDPIPSEQKFVSPEEQIGDPSDEKLENLFPSPFDVVPSVDSPKESITDEQFVEVVPIVETEPSIPLPSNDPVGNQDSFDIEKTEPKTTEQVKTAPIKKSRSRVEWEMLIGGKWLNRVGALAIIFGMAFFFKYAIDHNWISETLRVIFGYLFAIGLLILGVRTHKRDLRIFAQGVIGAGIAVAYTASYASFNFYHLVPSWLAILLMSMVTGFAFMIAYRYQSLSVAVLAWIGGFATPFLVSAENGTTLGLYSYLGFLTIGILVLVWMQQKWMILYGLTFGALYLIIFNWIAFADVQNDRLLLTIFALLFWLIFYLMEQQFRGIQNKWTTMINICAVLNVMLFVLETVSIHSLDRLWYLGLLYIVVSGAYLYPIFSVIKTGQLEDNEHHYVKRMGLIFLSLVTIAMMELLPVWIPLMIGWTIWGLMSIWFGVSRKINFVHGFGSLLLGCATLMFFKEYIVAHTVQLPTQIFHGDLGLYLIVIASLYAAGRCYHRLAGTLGKYLEQAFHLSWAAITTMVVLVEISFNFGRLQIDTQDVIYMNGIERSTLFLSLLLLAFGFTMFIRGKNYFLFKGYIWFLQAIGWLGIIGNSMDLPNHIVIWNLRSLALLGAIVLLSLSLRYGSSEINSTIDKWVSSATLVGIVVLLFKWVSSEVIDFFYNRIDSIGSLLRVRYLQNEVLPISWILLSIGLAWFSAKRSSRLLQLCSWVIVGISILYTMTISVGYEPIETFVPIINLRMVTFASVVLGILFHLWLNKQQSNLRNRSKVIISYVFPLAAVVLSFVWVNIEVMDFFRRQFIQLGDWPLGHDLRNQSLSISWLLFSLLVGWLSSRFRSKLLLVCSWFVLGGGFIYTTFISVSYSVVGTFVPFINLRMFSFLLLAFVLLFQLKLRDKLPFIKNYSFYLYGFVFAAVAVIFEIATVEVNHTFRYIISGVSPNNSERIHQLENLASLTISITWLLFSCVLLWIGVWKKLQGLRLVSIGVIGLSILKIFLYDLSFLDTLYRIFSFIILGFILLVISYLYQKKKHWFITR